MTNGLLILGLFCGVLFGALTGMVTLVVTDRPWMALGTTVVFASLVTLIVLRAGMV